MTSLRFLLAMLVSVAVLPLGGFSLPGALAQEATPTAAIAEATPASLAGVTPHIMSDADREELAAYITAIMEQTQAPGAAVAIVQGGEVVYNQGFGVRELGGDEPVTPETLMMIGSVTKSFTSAMTATLVDDGTLTWETPVVDLLPSFTLADAELTRQLTIRDAFCACTGLPQLDGPLAFSSDTMTPEMLIASVAEFPLTAPLGELFQYSNQMYAIGGYAAAAAAEPQDADLYAAYTSAMQQRLLDPLGMTQSTFDLAKVEATGDFALPHASGLLGEYVAIPLEQDDSFVTSVAPAGGLWSNVSEMARYVQMQLAGGVAPDGARVVSEDQLRLTQTQQIAFPENPDMPPAIADTAKGYGLGWAVGSYYGQPLLWHSGGTFGFGSELALLPEADLGIVILSNTANAEVFNLGVQMRALELLFDQPMTFDAVVTQALEGREAQIAQMQQLLHDVDEETAAQVVGEYRNAELGSIIVSQEGETLVIDGGEVRSSILTAPREDGQGSDYIATDPPLSGISLLLDVEDGVPSISLLDPVSGQAYRFARSDAVPDATPVS